MSEKIPLWRDITVTGLTPPPRWSPYATEITRAAEDILAWFLTETPNEGPWKPIDAIAVGDDWDDNTHAHRMAALGVLFQLRYLELRIRWGCSGLELRREVQATPFGHTEHLLVPAGEKTLLRRYWTTPRGSE